MARNIAKRGMGPAALLGGAVVALALPSAVLAFSARLDVPSPTLSGREEHRFAATEVDPRLARIMDGRPGHGVPFRYTPAGLVMRPDRAVTVAVRVDSATAREIVVRGFVDRGPTSPAATALSPLRIAPTAYNLGVAHGYHGFAQPQILTPGLGAGDIRRIDMPDLSAYTTPDGQSAGTPSRLAAHISLDERERAGRAPRTLEGVGTQTVDVGGSYRLSRNLDVTAGVRYSRDRDRMQPITDGKTDSQAVFVGTQFKF